MIDLIRQVQKLANQCSSGKVSIEAVTLRLDVIAQNGLKQRHLCAKALKQCGMYVGVEKMEKETQQLIDIDLDHTINDEHEHEQF